MGIQSNENSLRDFKLGLFVDVKQPPISDTMIAEDGDDLVTETDDPIMME